MAELATIARPYADALFKAAGDQAAALTAQMNVLAAIGANADLRQFADNPKVAAADVYQVVSRAAGTTLDPKVANLLQAVVENGRLAALPEISEQFKAHVNARSGSSDAIIYSAYPIEGPALAEVVAVLEKRFARRLNPRVELDPQLIGGIRVVVGDEVLDTSVRARLEQMKVALTA